MSSTKEYRKEWETTHKEVRGSLEAESSKKNFEREIDHATALLPLSAQWHFPSSENLVRDISRDVESYAGSRESEIGGSEEVEALINATRRFGELMAVSKWRMDLGNVTNQRIVAYRELVFTSVCITLLECGIDEDQVNRMMRLAFGTSSGDRNLRRLRNGAHWVHRMIRTLLARQWGQQASNLFFYCKKFTLLVFQFTQLVQWDEEYSSTPG